MPVQNTMTAPKGMNDILPTHAVTAFQSDLWHHIVDSAREVLSGYGFRYTWLPIVESTHLFCRGLGDATDIVSKEMYNFTDRGDRPLTLRPEGTAGAARAYVQHRFAATAPLQRWWYCGPMYRAERPQKGRYRQFYQIGAELFGAATPAADAQMIEMLWYWCKALGLRNFVVRINTLGDDESRANYRLKLLKFLTPRQPELCESCHTRMEINPLRVLDCKRESCRLVVKNAPTIDSAWSDPALKHFQQVTELLIAAGVEVIHDPCLVRGLDYYTGTLFEFTTQNLGAQDAILGGGRYDKLVQELGGQATPAIGFAAGIERIALLLDNQSDKPERVQHSSSSPHLYIVPMVGMEGHAAKLATLLRDGFGRRIEVDVTGGRIKQQMKRADKSGALLSLVLGEGEIESGELKLKQMATAEVHTVAFDARAINTVISSAISTVIGTGTVTTEQTISITSP